MVNWLIITFGIFTPGPKVSHTSKDGEQADTGAAIEAAFSQLGYPIVKAEQLEATREFVKGQDVFDSNWQWKALCNE